MAWPRLTAAATLALAAPLCAPLPALGALGVPAALLVTLNLVEHRRVERARRGG